MPIKAKLHLILLSCSFFICTFSQAQTVTKTITVFTDIAGEIDENINYEAIKGKGTANPRINEKTLLVYQNGGQFIVRAKNGVTITAISIGSTMRTNLNYSIDDINIAKKNIGKDNGKLELSELTVKDHILFTCISTEKKFRLNINYLSVTYIKPAHNIITLDESKENNTFVSGPATVTLYRTFNMGAWNTLALPFAMTQEQIAETFGPKAHVANYTGSTRNADNTYTLNFDSSKKSIEANKPVFIYGAINKPEYKIENVILVEGSPNIETAEGFNFAGSYHRTTVQENDWFVSSDNKFYQAVGTETLKPFRAVFRPVSNEANAKALTISIAVENDAPTIIQAHSDYMTPATSTPLYNLSGQRVNKYYKGIVIQNGIKKINK